MKKKIFSLIIAAGMLLCAIPVRAQETRVDVIVGVADGFSPELCADELARRFPGAEIHYVYDTLINGFSVCLDESQCAMLGSLGFVSDWALSGTYEELSTAQSRFDELSGVSDSMIGIDEARKAGLDGSGTIVAVIDSGFDVDHSAFSNQPGSLKLTRDYLDSLMSSMKLSAVRGGLTADDLYISDRIPFAFDYAESDADVSSDSNHGTHVAGIVGAYKSGPNGVWGIAPKCQLLLMKIFGEDGTTTDFALIAALEDAVRLGADVINLSLGRYSGSAEKQMINGLDMLLKRAEEQGCLIVCAAGNESNAAARSASDDGDVLPPADYTDYGTVSYPASAKYTLAVGSVDSPAVWGTYFTCGDLKVYYTDNTRASKVLNSTFPNRFRGSFPYEIVPGVGKDEDYEGLNVKDKLVLVDRGEITFVEKANIAAEHGALGVIVCNNVENESINLELTGAKIPAIAISKADGEALKGAKSRRVVFDPEFKVTERGSNAGMMSSFSSVGATPSLTLGIDIVGVGGGVYSTLPDGYGGLSGTSMASPQIAGVCALLCQKLGAGVLPVERMKAVKETLQNTAKPVIQENGVEFSPRSQGAGLVDIGGALSRELSVTYNGSPKAELADLLGDQFWMDVTLKNLTDEPLEVSLGVSLTSDGYTEKNGVYYSTLQAEADRFSRITVESVNLNRNSDGYEPLTLTLAPGESRVVGLVFELDEEYDSELSEVFTNGRFAEGFVYCSTGEHEYSLPYMGYIGDWSGAPILDFLPESGKSVFGGTFLLTDVSGILLEAGVNYFTEEKERGAVAFSPDGNGAGDVLWLKTDLLRNAVSGFLSVTDETGEEVYRLALSSYQSKSEGIPKLRAPMLCWDGSDGSNASYKLPDGKYTLNYTFRLDFYDKEQTVSFDALLDTKKPLISAVSYDPERKLLTVSAADDNELQYIKLSESDKDEFRRVAATTSDEYTAEFDLTEFDGGKVYIEVVDKAFNSVVMMYTLSELGGGR